MQPNNRVIWKNGTFLTPQHFQQADRALAAQLSFLQRADSPLAWGLIKEQLDPIALSQGRLKLDVCQGFLPPPDGMAINVAVEDLAPEERSFSIPDGVASIEVFVTLPAPSSADRFIELEKSVEDLYSATSVRAIKVATKKLALAVTGEPLKNLSALKIAEIERDERTGKPTQRKTFAPPCLVISAAPALQQLVRELLTRMAGLVQKLPRERKLRRSEEYVQFLRAVNEHLAPLAHLIQEAAELTHPAVLFEALLRLGAGLASFFDEPEPFPRYDHANPTRCFTELCRQLDVLLGFSQQPEDQVFTLSPKIESADNRIWIGKLPPGKPAASVPVFLALRGDLPAAKLISELEHKGKLAPASRITEIVGGFAAAVPFRHEVNLPPRQQAQPGIYYRVQTADPLWDEVCRSGEIALYIPSLLRGDKLPTVEVIYAGVGGPP